MEAPKAKKIPHTLEIHGDVRQDEYYWLNNKMNPEVIAYLEAENQYYEETMKALEPLSNRLFEKMVDRIPEAETKVPVQSGSYFYYTRLEKDLQYPVYARKKTSKRAELDSVAEEIVLDLNALAEDGGYLSVTVQRVSPDGTRLAYLENRDGTDRYTAYIKDLTTGELLADRIDNVFIGGSLEWDATGSHLFYVTVDDTQRPYQLWRHAVGETGDDVLLYEETDITYTLGLAKSRSGKYLFAQSENKETSEVRYLNAEEPMGSFQLFDARRVGVQYEVEHHGNAFLILTNEGASNFTLLHCPTDDTSVSARQEVFPYDSNRYLQGLYPFQDAVLLSGREGGLTEVWVYRNGHLKKLVWEEPLYTVSIGENRSYTTTEVLIQYESTLTPKTTFGVNLLTEEQTCLQVSPVPGAYDVSQYRQERLWATARDGVKVPLFTVYRVGSLDNGPAPLVLYGYGSYGANSDPHFDPMRLPLLDAGVVMVTAQVRGGSEMGHSWYEDGKFLNKRNTFTDFVAAAEDLIARGYTTSSKLAAQGGSAGGLLMGAVANLAGDLFQVMMPAVPFVDVVTTMLDESIPLTTLEWDEWGNPNDPTYYAYMKSYSPYDNVEAKAYPHMLVTTGLNDPRVGYFEPAKWVARLRAMKTDTNTLLLKTNMGAGHFGASGRVNRIKELATQLSFMLDKIGITEDDLK
ncbi:S9 family peptidase [Alicyclobacillus ferrooxydans]|uniref:Protease 2 n=1 Tax=Alicyclobacillus ferrooxydans TaxID=471514 RepID=A0A0P9EH00_9BACL|nr:S9 family peptidase [Alicyclobacillus ferrooxydans]KPV41824.1 protease 2 [Alicyclobacillus ferrooxydans]